MIYIVHGDDIVKSRTLILNQQKKQGIEKRNEVELSGTTPEKLYEMTHAGNLFGEETFLVLNISKSGNKNLEPYVTVLDNLPTTTGLIVLSDKSLSASNAFMKNAGKLKAKVIETNKIPESNIFKFLDALFTKDRKNTYLELAKMYREDIDQFEIFSKILWELRIVSQAKFASPSHTKLNPFVQKKSLSQAKLFTEDSLKILYENLYLLDKHIKTGVVMPEMFVTLAVEKVINS